MQRSAGILLFRLTKDVPEVLLVHPGGPFRAKRDSGVWSIPKGLLNENEEPLQAAIREVEEETGIQATGEFIGLTAVKQNAGKLIYAWALEMNVDLPEIRSNTFELEWPKGTAKRTFPEIDKASWFTLIEAKQKILEGQLSFITELERHLQHKIRNGRHL